MAYQTKKPFDVILFVLPSDTQSLELVKELHSIHLQVPIVVVSTLKDELIALKAVEIWAQDYLIKEQTNAHLLVRTLQYAIERQKLCSQLQQTKQLLQQTERERLLAEMALQIRRSPALSCSVPNAIWERYFKLIKTDCNKCSWVVNKVYEQVPISLAGKWDYIGFDNYDVEPQWTDEKAILTDGSISGAIIPQLTEDALRESEERFRVMADSAPVLLWMSDSEAVCTFFNKPWLDFTGRTLEQELGIGWTEGVHPEDQERCLDTYLSAFNTHQNFRMEYRLRHAKGEYRWLLATGVPRFTPSGSFYGYIGSCVDITEHKQIETELRDNKEAAEAGSRAKSEFLAAMSHELRTPLNAILGLSHLLDLEIFGSLNAKQKEYVTCIHSSGEHLLALINDILDLSKVEAGKEELSCIPLQVRELSDYCIRIVRERAFEKGLKLTIQIDPQADICIGDQRRVTQMLLNLLINAIKFTPSGTVSLQIQKVPQGIAFIVADTGIGIAPEQLKLLFQPFKQLDSMLNRHYEGTGLGLALTRKLARLHGGDVTVQSTLGEGSQFTLLLPGTLQQPVTDASTPDVRGS